MTKREAAIVAVYTGTLLGDLDDVYAYAKEVMGRPVYTHEFPQLHDELKKRSKPDFIALSITER